MEQPPQVLVAFGSRRVACGVPGTKGAVAVRRGGRQHDAERLEVHVEKREMRTDEGERMEVDGRKKYYIYLCTLIKFCLCTPTVMMCELDFNDKIVYLRTYILHYL